MELRQLGYFVAVAEERSFTRGAMRENVVQSAVSAAVSRLEQEFGTVLFDRSNRRIELTAAGRTLLGRARVVLGEAQRAHDEMARLTGGLRGTVTIGTVLSTGSFDLVGALSAFQADHPDVVVQLRLSAGPLSEHAEALREGRFDLMLLPIPPSRSTGAVDIAPEVAVDEVAQMRMGLACRADDALARAHAVTYADLADRRFVDFPEGWGNRTIVDGLFARAGTDRTVALEVVDVATALTMVHGRLGLAFVPEDAIATRPGLTAVDLADPPPIIGVGLAVSRNRPRSEAAHALCRTLLDRRAAA